MRAFPAWSLALFVIFRTAPGLTCPVCDSGTGKQVRTGIGVDFAANLLATTAPFLVLSSIVLILHFGLSKKKSDRKHTQEAT